MTSDKKTKSEKFAVSGSHLVERVKQLIHEGNIRRIRIIHDGKTVLEIPLTIGAPAAAIGILAVGMLVVTLLIKPALIIEQRFKAQ